MPPSGREKPLTMHENKANLINLPKIYLRKSRGGKEIQNFRNPLARPTLGRLYLQRLFVFHSRHSDCTTYLQDSFERVRQGLRPHNTHSSVLPPRLWRNPSTNSGYPNNENPYQRHSGYLPRPITSLDVEPLDQTHCRQSGYSRSNPSSAAACFPGCRSRSSE